MKKAAILGANGFVGTRLIEMLALGGAAEARPIVRRFSALASLARFELDARVVGEGGDIAAAMRGCDFVVNAVAGNPKDIVRNAETIYGAAQAAGVKRIVHLSSASVHGQAPAPETTEETAISDDQSIEYNNAKVRAEKILQRSRAGGAVELVILRPSIVFGPRSRWVEGIAKEIQNGTAYLVDGGRGYCNTVYVDNLIGCILAAAEASGADGGVFFVGDDGSRSWRDYYLALAAGVGAGGEIRTVAAPPMRKKGIGDYLEEARKTELAQRLLKVAPAKLKNAVKGAIKSAGGIPKRVWVPRPAAGSGATLEMALLHQSQWKLSSEKAKRTIGYAPTVSFEEGLARSIEWLRWKQ